MNTAEVLPFPQDEPTPQDGPARLQCPRCGASTEAKCDCGVDYRNLQRPGKRAEEAVTQHPEMSNRAIAEEIGTGERTVRRARKKAGAANAAAGDRRLGRDGKAYPATGISRVTARVNNGSRITVREGETVESLCRRGMALESEMPQPDAVRQLGIGKQSFSEARTIILLSDRTDLNDEERALVQAALNEMNTTRRTRWPYESVLPLADRIWGKRKAKTDKSAKRQLEQFESAVGIVIQSCASSANIVIPRLDPERMKTLEKELQECYGYLRNLITRIKTSANR